MIPTFIKRPDGSVFVNKTKRHVRNFWVLGDPKTVALTAAGTPGAILRGVPFEIDTQGHFEWAYLMGKALDDGQILNTDYRIRIFDPGTRRDLMNEFIHANTIVGTAQRPGILTETYLLNTENAGRELQIDFENLRNEGNNIELVLSGRRWYHKECPPDIQIDMRKKFLMRERTTHYWLTTKDGPFTIPANGRRSGYGSLQDHGLLHRPLRIPTS
jgi:hypothetical protein